MTYYSNLENKAQEKIEFFDPTFEAEQHPEFDDEHLAILDDLKNPLGDEIEKQQLETDLRRQILSALLNDQDFCKENLQRASLVDFITLSQKAIFKIITTLSNEFTEIPDYLSVRNELQKVAKNEEERVFFVAELEAIKEYYEPSQAQREYLTKELAGYARKDTLRNAIALAGDFIKGENPSEEKFKKASETFALAVQPLSVKPLEEEFPGYSLDELADLVVPDEQLVGHFRKGNLVVTAALAGAGKSFFAMYQGLCVATGTEFLNTFPVTKGGVAYLNSEDIYGYRARALAWAENYNVQMPKQNEFYVLDARIDLVKNPGQILRLAERIKRRLDDPQLVVIDNLNNNFGGNNKRDGVDMQKAVDNCYALSKALNGATIHILHNFGREMDREKDAVELRDAADAIFFLRPHKEYESNLSANPELTVIRSKGRNLSEFRPYKLIKKISEKHNSVWWKIQSPFLSRLEMMNKPELELSVALFDKYQSFNFTTGDAVALAKERNICQERKAKSTLAELAKDKLVNKQEHGNYRINPSAVEAFTLLSGHAL